MLFSNKIFVILFDIYIIFNTVHYHRSSQLFYNFIPKRLNKLSGIL